MRLAVWGLGGGEVSEPPASVTSARQRSGASCSLSQSTSPPLICDHVSPAATRSSSADRFHLSSASGSQYPKLSPSRSPCPAAGLPELIS